MANSNNNSVEAVAQVRGTESPTSRALSDGNADAGSAPSSNTALSTSTELPSGTQILRAGVDSLYLSFPGELAESSAIRLDELKRLAQSDDKGNVALAQWEINEFLFSVRDRGRHPYQYILENPWFRLEVAGLASKRVPLVYSQLRSEALTFEGPMGVAEPLSTIVDTLGIVTGPVGVSRVDLCVDFTTDANLDAIGEQDWVTRARTFDRYTVKRQFSGWRIGVGGSLSARLYNKTLEIETSGKEFFYDVWSDMGWDGTSPVWRLEFQFRREALQQFESRSLNTLLNNLGGLWHYATSDWLRLCIPNPADKTQSRWPLHPLWQIMQSADWGVEMGLHRRQAPTSTPPSDRFLFVNGLSPLTSYMAREGLECPYEAAPAFLKEASDYHDGREYLTGKRFVDYIAEKVSLKSRQYNTFKNTPKGTAAHPADVALAKEYRRRSDGE